MGFIAGPAFVHVLIGDVSTRSAGERFAMTAELCANVSALFAYICIRMNVKINRSTGTHFLFGTRSSTSGGS